MMPTVNDPPTVSRPGDPPRSTLTHRLDALAPAGVSRFHHNMTHAEFEAHIQQMRDHLRSQVNAAITFAGQQGLPAAEAIEIVFEVAADSARFRYGTSSLQGYAQKVVDRGGAPFNETSR